MKAIVLVYLGVAMGISPAYAAPFKAPELEPSIKSAALASATFTLQEYSIAFQNGARHACNQSKHATQRYADMLQANCVVSDIRAKMDWGEIRRNCFTDARRSSFEKQAEETCVTLSANSSFLPARDRQ